MIQKAFEITNFLNESEIFVLEKIQKKLEKNLNQSNEKKAYTNGFDYNLIKKLIQPKLNKIFGTFGVTDCMILEEFIPWAIHTDYIKKDSKPYYACLIPLSYEGKITHTIVFNEVATTANWKEELPDINYKFDNDTLSLLDHCPEEQLKKVSLYNKYKWERGNLIAWNRTLLHTSDNFIKAGITIKTALVLFLNLDNEKN